MRISDWSSDVCSSDLACSAQMGSTSVTRTRAPPLRSDAADPLPTSPKPATQAILPASMTSVARRRSEEHTSELQSLMRISYAVFCLQKKKYITTQMHSYQYLK